MSSALATSFESKTIHSRPQTNPQPHHDAHESGRRLQLPSNTSSTAPRRPHPRRAAAALPPRPRLRGPGGDFTLPFSSLTTRLQPPVDAQTVDDPLQLVSTAAASNSSTKSSTTSKSNSGLHHILLYMYMTRMYPVVTL